MPTGRTTRPTVLVCDDEPVLRMLVRATLDAFSPVGLAALIEEVLQS
jgi:hypothetical protein